MKIWGNHPRIRTSGGGVLEVCVLSSPVGDSVAAKFADQWCRTWSPFLYEISLTLLGQCLSHSKVHANGWQILIQQVLSVPWDSAFLTSSQEMRTKGCYNEPQEVPAVPVEADKGGQKGEQVRFQTSSLSLTHFSICNKCFSEWICFTYWASHSFHFERGRSFKTTNRMKWIKQRRRNLTVEQLECRRSLWWSIPLKKFQWDY